MAIGHVPPHSAVGPDPRPTTHDPTTDPHSGVGGEPVSSGKNRNEIAITADLPTITTRGPSLEYGNKNKNLKHVLY